MWVFFFYIFFTTFLIILLFSFLFTSLFLLNNFFFVSFYLHSVKLEFFSSQFCLTKSNMLGRFFHQKFVKKEKHYAICNLIFRIFHHRNIIPFSVWLLQSGNFITYNIEWLNLIKMLLNDGIRSKEDRKKLRQNKMLILCYQLVDVLMP